MPNEPNRLQLRRGIKSALPVLKPGEPGFVTDEQRLYIGTGAEPVAIAKQGDIPTTAAQVGAVPTSRKINGKILSTDITLSASDVGAAALSRSVAVTLRAASWSGAGPYTQTVSVSGLTSSGNGDIGLSHAATAVQRAAARSAMLSVTGQAAGSITVTADGVKPTEDIACVVTILG